MTGFQDKQHYLTSNVCGASDSDATTYDSECLVSCAPGYEGLTLPFTCGPDGQWEGDRRPTCTPVNCGRASAALAPFFAEAPRCTVNPILGAVCEARCLPGYIGTPAQAVCATSGEWETAILCTPIDCGKYAPKVEGSATQRDRSQTAVIDLGSCGTRYTDPPCTPNCTQGYPDRLSIGASIECEASGEWSGTFRCTGIAAAAAAIDTGTAAGLTVGGLVLIVLLGVLVLVILRRQKRQDSSTAMQNRKRRPNSNQVLNPLHHSFKNGASGRKTVGWGEGKGGGGWQEDVEYPFGPMVMQDLTHERGRWFDSRWCKRKEKPRGRRGSVPARAGSGMLAKRRWVGKSCGLVGQPVILSRVQTCFSFMCPCLVCLSWICRFVCLGTQLSLSYFSL